MLDKRLNDLRRTTNVDILFLGSSLTYRSFDPRIFEGAGLSAFNLGSSSQTHIQTNFLIKEYIDQLNPRIVVYEVTPQIFAFDGVESGIDIISTAEDIDINLLHQVFSLKNVKVFNTFILKLWYNIFDLSFPSYRDNSKNNYIKGGYVERIGSFDSIIPKPVLNWEPRTKQIKAFERNLDILNRKDIPYILVQVPLHLEFKNQKDIDKFFIDKGDYYDYNKLLKFQLNRDFFDSRHLNQRGVEKLNPHLIRILKTKYLEK